MKPVYYNEFEPFAADWIERLAKNGVISDGDVDRRSIKDVRAEDLAGRRRVHLFAGIAGWEEALRLAGWPEGEEVWTGSCPCQPYSPAGRLEGNDDSRNLWPEMFRLVRECMPGFIVGEQVPGAIKFGWLDQVFVDLESQGYACWPIVLGAHSVGIKQHRKRIYWAANSRSIRRRGFADNGGGASGLDAAGVASPGVGVAGCRRSLVEHLRGLPARNGVSSVVERRILHGYGNAIVPQVAALFIRSFMELVAE